MQDRYYTGVSYVRVHFDHLIPTHTHLSSTYNNTSEVW